MRSKRIRKVDLVEIWKDHDCQSELYFYTAVTNMTKTRMPFRIKVSTNIFTKYFCDIRVFVTFVTVVCCIPIESYSSINLAYFSFAWSGIERFFLCFKLHRNSGRKMLFSSYQPGSDCLFNSNCYYCICCRTVSLTFNFRTADQNTPGGGGGSHLHMKAWMGMPVGNFELKPTLWQLKRRLRIYFIRVPPQDTSGQLNISVFRSVYPKWDLHP